MAQVMQAWAGAFKEGGSDKVWAGCWKDDGSFCIQYGKRGSNLASPVAAMTPAAAEAKYLKKKREKENEGYIETGFGEQTTTLPSGETIRTNIQPFGNPVLATDAGQTREVRESVHRTAHLTPLDFASATKAVADGNHGIQEKVNGARCVVSWKAGELCAYNRRGQLVNEAPEGAGVLRQLGVSCVLDGERMEGDRAGQYVVFDVLEWDDTDVRKLPYAKRFELLYEGLTHAGVVQSSDVTPFLELPKNQVGFALLSVAKEGIEKVAARIEKAGGEGIVVRTLNAPYTIGDTTSIRKFKFQADLDAVVVSVKAGIGGGSAMLGLRRPQDNSWIDVGSVRSGLTEDNMKTIVGLLDKGVHPVLAVSYLPARTVGIKLVEAKAKLRALDSIAGGSVQDKSAEECTTDQLGADKAKLIAAAKPLQFAL